jgi:tetratricopeptide (TPR) repeat protein
MFHAHLGLGRCLVLQAHYEEAITPLTAASKLDRTHSEVMYAMGLAYYGLRSKPGPYKKTASLWLESALKSKPEMTLADRAEAHYKLGDLYVEQNKPADAARAFDAATRIAAELETQTGKGPDWLTETYYRLGQVYEGQNDKANQKRAWDRFLSRNPKPSTRVKTAEYWLGTTGKNY